MDALLLTLAVLACPVGMGLMAWMMMRGHGSKGSGQGGQDEVARLRDEIDQLKADRAHRREGTR